MYARLAARPLAGGTYEGAIPPHLTDVPRGVTLIVNGTTVTENRTPYQDDLANADARFCGTITVIYGTTLPMWTASTSSIFT